jgi:predicted O-linked N-acetylglucosamine transferase (SPINDLY family)
MPGTGELWLKVGECTLGSMLRRLLKGFASRRAADRLIAAGNRAESEGKPSEACLLYREALQARPGDARANLNLGVALEAMGEGDAALQAYRDALAAEPANPFAHYNLGKLLLLRGDNAAAAGHLRTAVERKGDFIDARIVLASALEFTGDTEGALATLDAALKRRPDYAGAWYNYGLLLRKLGRSAQAETALRRAIALEPNNAALFQLAKHLRARGEFDEGEALLRGMLERAPDTAELHVALFEALKERGRHEAAVAELAIALRLRPDWAELWLMYAEVLKTLQQLPECEAAVRRALTLDRSLSAAYRLLGAILVDQLRVAEALEVYAAGREFDRQGYVDVCELFVLNFHDGISSEALFERHRAFGEKFEREHPPRFARHANRPDPDRPLRIGYVSGDFRAHPVGWAFMPLVENHDRAACEAYCYSVYEAADQFTRYIAERADRWRNVALVPAAEVADIIHRDGIDVLVDLSGYAGIPTFDIMAHRPAPVQASWLGYLSTSGLTRIDYRITDAYADPPGIAERFHTEQLLRLPHSQWCYRPVLAVDVPPAPFAQNGFITFGVFNQSAKVSPSARRLWAEVLKRVPGSRLLIVGVPPGPATQMVLDDFARHGVSPGTVKVEARLSLEDYFRTIGSVDIALDPMPYSGGTTTCDTLWMGTPVVAMTGDRSVSRSAASILSVLGLEAWIASSPEEYVERAVALARQPGSGRGLRERMRASPLMDEARFARDMEALYRQAWRTWCAKIAK